MWLGLRKLSRNLRGLPIAVVQLNFEENAMKIRPQAMMSNIALVFLLVAGGAAESAELNVLAAYGMQSVVENLAPKFERATGHKLSVAFATGGGSVKRAQEGEAIDVVIAPREGIDGLVKSTKVAGGNVTALASTSISVAVRKGAVKPDISSPEALKRALLAAKSITYLNPADGAASGIHFAKVLDRLGIANDMKSKTVYAPKTSAVGAFVANGEVEIGVVQYQLLFKVPGIEIVGPLPGDLQATTVFSAAIMSGSKELETAKAFVTFLRSAEGAAVIKADGMDPAGP
jgi:molybdate transport system substrate-binding protein